MQEGESFIEKLTPGSHKNNNYTVSKMIRHDGSGNKTGEVDAEDVQQDSEYLAQIAVGTPAQHFNVDFDTGSADMWLWSTYLDDKVEKRGVASGHNIFNPTKSST
jgi:hypothetical protein